MKRIVNMDWKWLLGGLVLLDAVTAALGMGVPFFTILLGFPAGWFLAVRARGQGQDDRVLAQVFLWAVAVSFATLVFMLLVWGRTFPMLSASDEELAQFGVPLILYEPRASFVAWLVLMIVVSPVAQLLTTVFAAFLTLMVQGWPGSQKAPQAGGKKRKKRH